VADEDPRAAGPPPELGARIRAARVDAGVSVRGLAQPSVATLWALVRELDLSLDTMFAEPRSGDGADRPAIVQRAAKRPAIQLGGGVVWERLTAAPERDADFAFLTYPPGADSGPTTRRRATWAASTAM
jgi:hypothetical protein